MSERPDTESRDLPRDPSALNQLGLEYHRDGRLDDAIRCFQRATEVAPQYGAAHNHLGIIYRLKGKVPEAISAFRLAARYQPASAHVEMNLANALLAAGETIEAIERFRNAAELDPKLAEAHSSLATHYQATGNNAEAYAALNRALKVAGSDLTLRVNMANLLQEMGRHAEAEKEYKRALEFDSTHFGAHSNLAYLLADQSRIDESRSHYQAALRKEPNPRLKIVAATKIPAINDNVGQILECREQLARELDQLYRDGARVDTQRDLMPTLFYLAYHGKNDRSYFEQLARLSSRTDTNILTPYPFENRRLRLGFLSMNLKQHTIGGLWTGLIEGISRSDFEVCVLSANPVEDTITRRIRNRADKYVVLPREIPRALQLAHEQKLDFLLFPDIGMDPFTYTLAYSRIAPVQAVTWGHPTTTGLQTIDYFLSSEDLEIPESDDFYTEQLARFSRLMVCYDHPPKPTQRPRRSDFQLPESAHVYGCPQTLFKFHPDFDDVIHQILATDPDAILVMIEGRYDSWKEQLMKRFERKMGRLVDRIRFAPRLSRNEYLNLQAICDVLLDPMHFGGGNTSYEGFAMGVPIVTLPSPFLRARLTYAMYQQMGIQDFIVPDAQSYADLALRLGMDSDYRRAASKRISESAECLFEDKLAIRELEDFVRASVSAAAQSPGKRIVWRSE